MLLSAAAAYAVIHGRLPAVRENQVLVRDLPVIEHVDEYRNIGDIDFLVSVASDIDLSLLAKAGRRLKGQTQSYNCSADMSSGTSITVTSVEFVTGRIVALA